MIRLRKGNAGVTRQDIQEDYGNGPAMKTGFDCLEGQRPRLTHFSSAGGAESLSDTTPAEFTTEDTIEKAGPLR
jgi:hypothetical protein